jgi:hypothetical protein
VARGCTAAVGRVDAGGGCSCKRGAMRQAGWCDPLAELNAAYWASGGGRRGIICHSSEYGLHIKARGYPACAETSAA